jgi:hypothetical protein
MKDNPYKMTPEDLSLFVPRMPVALPSEWFKEGPIPGQPMAEPRIILSGMNAKARRRWRRKAMRRSMAMSQSLISTRSAPEGE